MPQQLWGPLKSLIRWQSKLLIGRKMKTFYKTEGDSKRTGTFWTTALLVSKWKGLYKIWKARCDKQHQSDKGHCRELRETRRTSCYQSNVRTNRQNPTVRPGQILLGTTGNPTRDAKPTRYFKAWIQTVKPILRPRLEFSRKTCGLKEAK